MPARPLNATAAALLGFLHLGPSSGWDLLATARTAIGPFWNLTSSQVYRELAALDRAGLIRAGKSGKRERRPYRLTATGRAAFAEWIQRPPGDDSIRHPLLLTISFGRHLPAHTLRVFASTHRETHVERLAGYLATRRTTEANPHPDPYLMATLDFGIRYETAVLDWFDHLTPEVGGPQSTPGHT
jgi:DNA-binding PadR family transcriptional regulator